MCMKQRFEPKSEFSRNILTLMTGTIIAQAIPIAISPILTRIYRPEDFGLYAIYVAIITMLVPVVSGRYEFAIMLPKKDEDAINIFALGILITAFMTALFTILVVVLNDVIVSWLNNQEIGFWLYFIPVSVFFVGCFNLLNHFNNRCKNYTDIKNSLMLKSITTAVVQLLVGLIKQGVTGLLSGQILSQAMANMQLLKNITKDKALLSKISILKVVELAKRYKDFPKFSIGAILANKLSFQLTNIIISSVYSVTTLGFYSLVQRVLGIPSSLIGNSIGRVFFQKAAIEKQQTGKVINTFQTTAKILILIGVPFFGLLFFTVENLFALVFGEPWRIAGEYAKIIIPFFFVQFVISTLSSVDTIMEKQNMDLLFNIVVLLVSLVVILTSSGFSFKIFLINWTVSLTTIYAIYGYVLLKMAKGQI